MIKGLLCSALLFCGIVFAQENEQSNKIKFYSASIVPYGLYGPSESGFALRADVTMSSNKHLFSLAGDAGSEIRFWSKNDSFSALNLLYGRQFRLDKNIYWDVHGGAGYFSYTTFMTDANNGIGGDASSRTVGVPVVVKLRFMLGNKFSMGLLLHANFNAEQVIYGGGLLLQFNGTKKQ